MMQWDMQPGSLSRAVVDREMLAVGRGLDVKFDEVALLARDIEHWQDCIDTMKKGGWEHFNSAADRVHTEPFGLSYSVRYAFLRHPDASWRVELMHAGNDGSDYSPLHEALRAQHHWEFGSRGGLPVVHFSYKASDEEQYEQEVERLSTRGYLHAQSCRSTYGRFSYMRQGITGIYVKPRVNLRDHATPKVEGV